MATPTKTLIASRRAAGFGLAAISAFAGTAIATAAAPVAADAATTGATTTSETSAAQALVADGYYRTPYNGAIYSVKGGVATQLTLNQFIAMGQPAFKNAPVNVVKYSWSSTLYNVVKWNTSASSWTINKLTMNDWKALGYAAPRNTAFIPGTNVFKFPNSAQVFFRAPDGAQRVVTWNEYVNAGMPAVGTIANQGYMKLSWSNEIGYFTDLAGGKGFTISLQQWIKDGAPAPQVVKRIPGDSFSKTNISSTIAYKSPLVSRNITFNEWVAAGMPSPSVTVVAQAATGDPRSIARSMLASYGWADSQFSCLDSLWQKESGWNYRATNPSSGAYGIPQSLPASKMATAGADYRTNPATQIRWGLGYIKDRYGSPCAAWSHSVAVNWY